eukprot:GHUV01012679.1.p1 GENE.GHUV01012679.1~~GHUV01012679.1.p1  ORF type:complete len:543 (+),score=113.65 GHUV01012679.1:290-1918(+)
MLERLTSNVFRLHTRTYRPPLQRSKRRRGLSGIASAVLKHHCPASLYWDSAKAIGSMAGRLPDPFLVATTKLSQEWSANRVVPHMNDEWLDTVLSDERFPKEMDNAVKCRLLLAGLLALNTPTYQDSGAVRTQLQASLHRLQQAAKPKEADEWFRITAAGAGPLDGRLHLDAVTQQSAVVQETVTSLKDQIQQSTNQHLFPPLESIYMDSNSSGFTLNPNAGHFTLRPNPRVQPLTTGVSYAAATPPPPALGAAAAGLQSPVQGDHTANPAWIRHKLQKADIVRTASLPAGGGVPATHPATATAAAEPGGSAGPSSRTKAAKAKIPRLQMLDEDEQQEMNKLMKEQSARKKDKGHGLALRHSETADHLIPTNTSTRVRHEDYNTPAAAAATGFRSAGIRLKMNPRGAAASAAGEDGAAEESGRHRSPAAAAAEDDYYENVRDDDEDFIVRGDVDYRTREGREQGGSSRLGCATAATSRADYGTVTRRRKWELTGVRNECMSFDGLCGLLVLTPAPRFRPTCRFDGIWVCDDRILVCVTPAML